MKVALKHKHHQSGSILVESIVVMPIFLIMVFGMMEMTYVFKAKNTLNLATQEAVRKGSFSNAKLENMQTALDKGMAPLYALKKTCSATGSAGTAVSATTGINPGQLCAQLIREEIDGLTKAGQGQGAAGAITIISPSLPIFKEFAVEMKIDENGEYGKGTGKLKAIPNDNLNWRETSVKSVTVGGKSIEINIQDANLLKIKTFWCQKLSVPGLDRIFYNTILRLNTSPEQQYCNQLSQQVGGTALSKTVYGTDQSYYMAIRSHAIARMQSPVLLEKVNDKVINLLSDSDIKKATDSTTPVTSTTPPPVDTTGTKPCVGANCPPDGGGKGQKDSNGCYADESFRKGEVNVIEGSRRKVDGGYCIKTSVDCSKDKNKNHKDCCAQSTTPVTTTFLFKGMNEYTKSGSFKIAAYTAGLRKLI